MATFLKPFRFAWKDLNDALEKIVSAVNCNAPLEGTGIHLSETGGMGVSINRSDDKSGNPDKANQQQQGSGGQAPHILLSSLNLIGFKWQDVTVVDPVSCAQSTVTVLTLTGNTNDSVVINFEYPYWADPNPVAPFA